MSPLTLLSSYHSSQTESESEEDVTMDGSRDYKGRPAIRSRTGAWKACSFLLWYNMIETVVLFGISSNLVTYLTAEFCEGTADSAKNVNNWSGFRTFTSIIGAFVADAYLGQYCTIALISIVYILGLISLTLSVVLRPLKSVPCDRDKPIPTIQYASFFISLYLIAIAMGVTGPCVGAFAADQFDATNPVERQKKKSFFNWWSFSFCFGSLLSYTVILYIQDNVGWGASYGIITVAMFISVILFLAVTPLYRRKPLSGSPFTSIVQVLVAAAYKWNLKVPENNMLLSNKCDKDFLHGGRRKLFHTEEFRPIGYYGIPCGERMYNHEKLVNTCHKVFLDKAAIRVTWKHYQPKPNDDLHAPLIIDEEKVEDGLKASVSPWKLCSVTQVEEVKLIARAIPIWIISVVFYVAVVQAQTFFTRQGITLDRQITSNFTIPAASLLSISILINLIFLPIYDCVFLPAARWLSGREQGITVLQRIGVGVFFDILMMLAAAFTEQKRLRVAEENGLIDNPNATIPMSIFWMLPQYVLNGLVCVFAAVGQQEFFYDQMPDTMKSMGMAFFSCSIGAGSYLSSFLIIVIDTVSTKSGGGQSWFGNNFNRCHLDYFFWLIASLCTLNFFVYLLVARSHVYKKIS